MEIAESRKGRNLRDWRTRAFGRRLLAAGAKIRLSRSLSQNRPVDVIHGRVLPQLSTMGVLSGRHRTITAYAVTARLILALRARRQCVVSLTNRSRSGDSISTFGNPARLARSGTLRQRSPVRHCGAKIEMQIVDDITETIDARSATGLARRLAACSELTMRRAWAS